jgi:hypothetical protein
LQDVPVITFALEDETADVYPLEVVLSLFETDLVVKTPYGNLDISTGLLGKLGIYGAY